MSKFSFSDWFDEEITFYFNKNEANRLKSYLESENITTVTQLEELDVNNLTLKEKSKTYLTRAIRNIKNIQGNTIYFYIC